MCHEKKETRLLIGSQPLESQSGAAFHLLSAHIVCCPVITHHASIRIVKGNWKNIPWPTTGGVRNVKAGSSERPTWIRGIDATAGTEETRKIGNAVSASRREAICGAASFQMGSVHSSPPKATHLEREANYATSGQDHLQTSINGLLGRTKKKNNFIPNGNRNDFSNGRNRNRWLSRSSRYSVFYGDICQSRRLIRYPPRDH